MTIFQVKRFVSDDGIHNEGQPTDVKRLDNGRHTISHNGLEVPVKVRGNRVTIDVQGARGKLTQGTIDGMGDDTTFEDLPPIKEIKSRPEEGESVLQIYSRGGGEYLTLERHRSAPVIPDWARRK